MAKVTIKDLLEAGVHFGHQVKRWNPKMKNYVYGAKNGIYIIDLTKTMRLMADACNFLQKITVNGGSILFVGTKRQAQQVVRDTAEKTEMYYVTERWLGGTLTNNVTIRRSVSKMVEIDKQLESDEIASMKKKEVSSLKRQSMRLHRNLDGIFKMDKLPDALVIVDVCHEDIALKEANKLKIPVVALVDTNGSPESVDYPIPANDDAVKSIQTILDVFCGAIKTAVDLYSKRVAEEKAAEAIRKAEEEKVRAEQAEKEKAEKAEKAEKDQKAQKTQKEEEKKKAARKKKPAAKKAKDADKKETAEEVTVEKVTEETAEGAPAEETTEAPAGATEAAAKEEKPKAEKKTVKRKSAKPKASKTAKAAEEKVEKPAGKKSKSKKAEKEETEEEPAETADE